MPDQPNSSPSLLQLAQAMAVRVRLEGITVTSSQTKLNLDIDELPDAFKLGYNFKVSGGCNNDHTMTRVMVAFKLAGRPETPEGGEVDDCGPDVFQIEATFALLYEIASFDGLNQDNVDAFGRMNGVFNAWPFWREFVHSSALRMGLPPVTVPLLTIGGLEKTYKEQARESASPQDAGSVPNP